MTGGLKQPVLHLYFKQDERHHTPVLCGGVGLVSSYHHQLLGKEKKKKRSGKTFSHLPPRSEKLSYVASVICLWYVCHSVCHLMCAVL